MSILHWLLKRVMFHSALGSGEPCPSYLPGSEESWPILHWVLGGRGLSYTNSWGIMVHPTLGPGVSWSVLHWLPKIRGPSCTWYWGIVVHSLLGSGGVATYPYWLLGGHSPS